MRRIWLPITLLVALATSSRADFSGTYENNDDGTKTVLTLVQSGSDLTGTVEVDGLKMNVTGKADGDKAEGRRVSVGEMASAASCSVRTLYRAFERLASIGPSEFELRCRLHLSRLAVLREALSETRSQDLSNDFGFPSANAFRHAYRIEFGETPNATARRRREDWEDFHDELDRREAVPSDRVLAASQ